MILQPIISENQSLTFTILNKDNNLYVQRMLIGSQKEEFYFKLDLWSDVSWLMSQNCTSCLNITKYNEGNSKNYINLNVNYTVKYPDLIDVYGPISSDNITIESIENKRFNFLLVKDVNDYYEQFVGAIGFGLPNNNSNTNNSLIYQLKSYNLISNLILGISLKNLNEQSKLMLGAYDTNIVKNVSEIKSCKALDNTLINSTFWGCQMNKIKIGTKNYNYSKPVVFDTSIEDIKIPLSDFLNLKDNIFKNSKSNCQYEADNYFHCVCSTFDKDSLNTIQLHLDNNLTINVSQSDYANIQNQSPDSINCVLFISVNYKSDLWIIGNNVLNNYYTILNFEDRSIGFYDIRGQNDIDASITILIITIIFVFSTCIFFIVLLAIYKKCSQNVQRNAYQQI